MTAEPSIKYNGRLDRQERWIKSLTVLVGAVIVAAVVWVGVIDDSPAITDEPFIGLTVFNISEMPAQVPAGGEVVFTRDYCNITDTDLNAIGDVGMEGASSIPISQGIVLTFPPGGSGCEDPTIDPELFPFTLPDDIPLGEYTFRFDLIVQDPQSARTQPKTAITNTFEVTG